MRSRRASLPTAEDLFAATGAPGSPPTRDLAPVRAVEAVESLVESLVEEAADRVGDGAGDEDGQRGRRPSGRVRHDEKMTVYVTAAELHDLEHARLTLRSVHGLRADRGRLVREALAAVLSDYEAHGADSVLVRRLTQA